MIDTLAQLRAISLPGQSPEEYQLGLRALLQAATPLVAKGTIWSVKEEVRKALSLPLDGSKECSEAHFWALHESWPYMHWDRVNEPIPADRQAMIELYKQMVQLGPNPFRERGTSRPKL